MWVWCLPEQPSKERRFVCSLFCSLFLVENCRFHSVVFLGLGHAVSEEGVQGGALSWQC